jgi:hypothetical protein
MAGNNWASNWEGLEVGKAFWTRDDRGLAKPVRVAGTGVPGTGTGSAL